MKAKLGENFETFFAYRNMEKNFKSDMLLATFPPDIFCVTCAKLLYDSVIR